MKHAIVAISESLPSVATILGQRQVRIPTGGKIRAGIKVLTKKAAEHPTAKQIYDRGVAGNQSFEEIERAISQAVPNLKTPLVPKNVAWFTVRPNDFPNPEIAGQIMDAFGEDRGDGIQRLYRFPVVFPADMWQVVMPHELVTWGANEKKFWSEYSSDGRVRYCKCYAPVPMDHSGKRAIRVFGGRKTKLREENDGICNPESCHQFQTRQCNLSGRFIFFIPGIKSIDAFELQTSSFYAMSRAIEQFKTLAFMRGGRISGFLDDKRTPIYFTKKLRDVPHIDETGRAVRAAHWIIELEAPIDVMALLRANDDDSVLANANEAAHLLEGTRHGADLEREGATALGSDVRDLNGNPSSDAICIGHLAEGPPRGHGNQATSPAPGKAAGISQGRNPAPSHGSAPGKEQVIAAAGEFGIDAVRYEAYAECHWGPGWMLNANGRRRALDEITRYKNDPDTFIDKVDAELKVAQKRV